MGIDWKRKTEDSRSRSWIYGLLATVFRKEPTPALVSELRAPELSEALNNMEVELGEGFFSAPEAMVAEALAEEFTRLFSGPGRHVSSHESFFAEIDGDSGSPWGKKAFEVKDFIEATGLDYESNFTGLPDHVSVELEFMRKLTEWEAEKWDQRNRQRAEYCIDVQRKFLERHLLNWLPRFCEVVMQRAELPFYRSMAELTRDYMLYERVNTRNPRGDRQVAQESLELSSKLSAV